MKSKSKYANSSKKRLLSEGSPKQENKLDIKMKKRMKPSSNNDPKIVYELSRKKFQLPKTNLTEAILSFSKMNLKLKKIAKKVSLITVKQNSYGLRQMMSCLQFLISLRCYH